MVDLLQAAKNVIGGKSPNYEPPTTPDNRIDRIDQCKVVWYQWQNELGTGPSTFGVGPVSPPTPSSILAASRSYDISNHIESVVFSKSMGNAAGSFAITLQNSFDWARWMRPGQWVCIYLTGEGDLPLPKELDQGSKNSTAKLIGTVASDTAAGPPIASLLNGLFSPLPELPLPKPPTSDAGPTQTIGFKKRLRCVGIIQRVGIRSTTSPDGTIDTVFTVTGKDFGTVFEETELWFNATAADAAGFDKAINAISQEFVRNLTELLNKWYDIFLNPDNLLSQTITSIKSFFPIQWTLPDQMVKDLGLKLNPAGHGVFGDIENIKEFNATVFENPDPNPLSGLQGRCWDRLKTLSQPEFHELFTELSDEGNPKLIFRPIPWAMDKSRYPTIGALMLRYQDLTTNQSVGPILPLGTNIGQFANKLDLNTAIIGQKSGNQLPSDARTQHTVAISAKEVESFDLGPDYHSRANFFLVDAMKAPLAQQNSFALLSKDYSIPWPLRDEADIKRHGFRPQFVNVSAFSLSNSRLFGDSAQIEFVKECNFLLKDLWSNAEDFYSGTMNLAGGRNDVKLGKVVITDDTFESISKMAFYIEGYTDSFNVNVDGTCSWTQSLSLTRGMQKTVLAGGSSKSIQSTEPKTFHTFPNEAKDGGILGTIKKGIKDPTSLF